MTGRTAEGWAARWRRRIATLPDVAVRHGVEKYNLVVGGWFAPDPPPDAPPELREVMERARTPTDISHHLPTLYREALAPPPRLIVELGTRGGDSTFVFERVARRTGAALVSVDLEDCSDVTEWPGWIFVREDDLDFARRFEAWCAERALEPAIDVLFIDTSHTFEHTLAELRAWMPFLGPLGRALLHDSNMGGLYRRRDFTVGLAADMGRGVIRAIHDFLGGTFDERRPFEGEIGAYQVWHDPLCVGLTVLRRRPS